MDIHSIHDMIFIIYLVTLLFYTFHSNKKFWIVPLLIWCALCSITGFIVVSVWDGLIWLVLCFYLFNAYSGWKKGQNLKE